MPTYVYKFVETGETIEVQQGFHDDTLTEIAHPDSGALLPVKKVFTPVGVTFKGSGFFKTDNRGKKAAPATGSTSGDGASSSGGDGSSGGTGTAATTSDKTSKPTSESKTSTAAPASSSPTTSGSPAS
jgi:predicted nucleic acid-binding Zn ribbon protein